MPISEALQITLDVARVLDGLRVSYLVCGSMASSVHGIPRATQIDAAFLAAIVLAQNSGQ